MKVKCQYKKEYEFWRHVPVMIHNIALAQPPQEILVVSDDDELEVGMILPFVDDTGHHRQICRVGPSRGTHSVRLDAKASIFSASRAFVGSSSARIPQFWPNESARASRMIIEANIFWPAEHRPRMSIST